MVCYSFAASMAALAGNRSRLAQAVHLLHAAHRIKLIRLEEVSVEENTAFENMGVKPKDQLIGPNGRQVKIIVILKHSAFKHFISDNVHTKSGHIMLHRFIDPLYRSLYVRKQEGLRFWWDCEFWTVDPRDPERKAVKGRYLQRARFRRHGQDHAKDPCAIQTLLDAAEQIDKTQV